MTLIGVNAALAEEKSITPTQCSIATHKGAYIYSSFGFLNGKPYAESGR
jgi:hypothetical protein